VAVNIQGMKRVMLSDTTTTADDCNVSVSKRRACTAPDTPF
jgi:hypothetical protein